MTRLRRYKPSPAMAVAIAALTVALGGAAFAALPSSDGAIHACYQKNTGDLRIVDSEEACRSSERAIAWNQRGPQGPPGGRVVARLRGGPLTTQPGLFEPIPLSRESWDQQPGEFQVLFLDARTAPPFCPLQLVVLLDGDILEQFILSSVTISSVGSSPQHALLQVPLFEPDAPATHTFSARIRAEALCNPDNRTGILDYLKANVVSFG
jgi:hypothetical protein